MSPHSSNWDNTDKHNHHVRNLDLILPPSELTIPGPFVVLQGIPGDGMLNTIDTGNFMEDIVASCYDDEDDDEDYEDCSNSTNSDDEHSEDDEDDSRDHDYHHVVSHSKHQQKSQSTTSEAKTKQDKTNNNNNLKQRHTRRRKRAPPPPKAASVAATTAATTTISSSVARVGVSTLHNTTPSFLLNHPLTSITAQTKAAQNQAHVPTQTKSSSSNHHASTTIPPPSSQATTANIINNRNRTMNNNVAEDSFVVIESSTSSPQPPLPPATVVPASPPAQEQQQQQQSSPSSLLSLPPPPPPSATQEGAEIVNHGEFNDDDDDDDDDDDALIEQWNQAVLERNLEQRQDWKLTTRQTNITAANSNQNSNITADANAVQNHNATFLDPLPTVSMPMVSMASADNSNNENNNNNNNMSNSRSSIEPDNRPLTTTTTINRNNINDDNESYNSSRSTHNDYHQQDDLWWLQDGKLCVFQEVPTLAMAQRRRQRPRPSPTPSSRHARTTTRKKKGVKTKSSSTNNGRGFHEGIITTLSPGITVIGHKLLILDSTTLRPVSLHDRDHMRSYYYSSSGKLGIIQLLQIEVELPINDKHDHQKQPGTGASATTTSSTGYIVYSVDGYAYVLPGTVTDYIDPDVWIWRVTCSVGAYVREGLQLETRHIATLPYGSFVRVTKKVVSSAGLSRLRIMAQILIDDNHHHQRESKTIDVTTLPSYYAIVEGWCSEFLNPASGQRGNILLPLPLPVPALYRVVLPGGAIVRKEIELASAAISTLTQKCIVSVVKRVYSEQPIQSCLERLQLTTNASLVGGIGGVLSSSIMPSSQHQGYSSTPPPGVGGWISVRLNKKPPHDEMVVELIGIDERFDPNNAGKFHLASYKQSYQYFRQQQEKEGRRNMSSAADSEGQQEQQQDFHHDISSIEDPSGTSGSSTPNSNSSSTHNNIPNNDNEVTSHSKKKSGANRRRNKNRTKSNSSRSDERCLICLSEERNATIVHGETGHIACCLICARILKARGDKCPVCRIPIDSVIQHFWA